MPTYKYEVMDASGMEHRDNIDAENEEDAVAKLRQMGYFTTRLQLLKGTKVVEAPRRLHIGFSIKWYDLFIGAYIDTKKGAVYIVPFPMCVLKFWME